MKKWLPYIVIFLGSMILFPALAKAQTESTEPLAIQYFQNGEYDKAAVLFEVLYNNKPDPRYYQYYFDCLLQLEDYKTAEKFASKQVKKFPGDPRYMVDLGYVLQKSGDTKNAEKQFDAGLKNVIPDRQGYIDLSNAFLVRGLNDYAINALLKAKKVLKYEPLLCVDLAEIYLKMGSFSLALDQYLELLDFGGEYMATVQTRLQDELAVDADNSKNELFRTHILERIRKSPDKIYYSELLLWYFIQQKDFSAAFIQAKSLDKRQNEEGARVYQLGIMAESNEDWDAAITCFEYIITLGQYNPWWFSSRVALMDTRYQKVTRSLTYTRADLEKLEQDFLGLLEGNGYRAETVPLMRNLAHIQAFYLDKVDDAIALLEKAKAVPGVHPIHQAECKLELADILLMTGDVWEATLLYSQVEKAFKNDPIGAEAKFRNAKLSFYIGEFEWSRAQLDVLKAATTKLIANDAMQMSLLISDNIGEDSVSPALLMYARADLLVFRRKYDEALSTLDSIQVLELYHPLFDEVLYKKAEIYLLRHDYVMADSLLRKLYEYYPFDILGDDALYKMAQLQETVFKDKDKAMDLYLELMQTYPGSLYVVEARKKYRDLRGDKLN